MIMLQALVKRDLKSLLLLKSFLYFNFFCCIHIFLAKSPENASANVVNSISFSREALVLVHRGFIPFVATLQQNLFKKLWNILGPLSPPFFSICIELILDVRRKLYRGYYQILGFLILFLMPRFYALFSSFLGRTTSPSIYSWTIGQQMLRAIPTIRIIPKRSWINVALIILHLDRIPSEILASGAPIQKCLRAVAKLQSKPVFGSWRSWSWASSVTSNPHLLCIIGSKKRNRKVNKNPFSTL